MSAAVAQVYVGTDERMGKAERVLEHSLRAHASIDVQIHWMRSGDRGFHDWSIGRERGAPYSGGSWSTDFTCFRFAVPELAGFRGRAIYLDADMLVLGDVAELWTRHLRRPWTCPGGRSEVSVIDCAAFEALAWWPRLRQMRHGGLHLGDYWGLLTGHELVDGSLPPQWNVLDRRTPDAKLIHFTDMETQPWKPWPEVFRYRRHPDPEAEQLFWEVHDAAVAEPASSGWECDRRATRD